MKPLSVTRVAKLFWFEGEWQPIGRCAVRVTEKLPFEGPRDARPSCYGMGEIDFFDASGNVVLGRRIRGRSLFDGGISPTLICVAGVWYEVGPGVVRYVEGAGWCSQWDCWCNTRAAHMANAGFYAFHRPEIWIRPLRWLVARVAYACRRRALALLSRLRKEVAQ